MFSPGLSAGWSTGRGDSAFFDETKALMAQRITKLGTGMSWAEDPPSRTRHLVSKVRITPVSDTEYDVDLAALRPWFEAERVLQDGVFFAAGKLFGLTFAERGDLASRVVDEEDIGIADPCSRQDGAALGAHRRRGDAGLRHDHLAGIGRQVDDHRLVEPQRHVACHRAGSRDGEVRAVGARRRAERDERQAGKQRHGA